jgi:multicomponent Na+:H+ antiporter subunit D
MIRILAPLPVVLPLLMAGVSLLLGRSQKAQRILSVATIAAVLVVAALLMVIADRDDAVARVVAGWPIDLGITLVVDRLAALMMVVSAVVLLGVLVYAVGQGAADGDSETPVSIFHPTYLILAAGVMNAFITGDLFNLFVGFEVLLAASYVLLTLGGTGPRVRAGITYLVVGLMSSTIFLIGIALVYAAVGTLDMATIGVRMAEIPEGVRTTIQLVLLVAFGIKAAVFPLSAWLPDSYPTAAAPVTAVFAGLLTKVGIYAIIRTQTLMFPDSPLDDLLLVVALLTMLVGILGAIAQTEIKRLLSFTLVSHIGYMVFGIALASQAGMAGAVYYVAHHILVQTTLFLTVGLIDRRAGSTSVNRLGGLAIASPLVALLFFIPAMNLAGIPPLSGFIGKLGLMQAGVATGGPLVWALVAGGTATGLLTLYAIARVWGKAFWRPQEQAAETVDDLTPGPASGAGEVEVDQHVVGTIPRSMLLSTAAMVVVGLTLTVFGGPLYAYSERAAADLITRGPYVEAATGSGP